MSTERGEQAALGEAAMMQDAEERVSGAAHWSELGSKKPVRPVGSCSGTGAGHRLRPVSRTQGGEERVGVMRTWQKWIDGAGRWAKGCWEEWAAQRRAAQQEKEERRGHTGAAGERGTGVHKQEWASRAEGQGEVTTGVGVERKGVGRGSVEGCTSTPGRMGGREQRARESEMEAVREGAARRKWAWTGQQQSEHGRRGKARNGEWRGRSNAGGIAQQWTAGWAVRACVDRRRAYMI